MARRIQKLNHRHMALLQIMIERPELTLKDCAQIIGYSPWQVSRIVNSPPFVGLLQHAQRDAFEEAIAVARRRVRAVRAGK